MRKLFTLFVFTLFALFSASALTITNQTWGDGTVANTAADELTTISTIVTYTSETLDTAYLLLASKDDWGTYWIQKPVVFPIAAIATELSIDFELRAYSTVANSSRFRVWIGPSATSGWGDKLSSGLFGDILEANGAPIIEEATKMVTDNNDENATPQGGEYAAGDTVILSVSYNSTKTTTFFVRFKSKDNATKFVEHDQALPITSTDTVYSFKVGIPKETIEYDSMRIVGWIGSWSADKELSTYINVSGAVAETVEEATKMVTDKHDDAAVPAGGVYEAGDTVTLSVTYNSTVEVDYTMSFKTSDNATLFFKNIVKLPATTEETVYDLKVEIPAETAACDSMMIVAWIGSYDGDKRLYEYINVTKAASVSSLQSTSLNVYPNPNSTGLLNIEATSGTSLRMVALNGKVVYQQSLLSGTNKIDVSSFNRGIYILTFQESNETKTVKVVLK